MATPLKVGLAGLGTVGASVVRLIDRQRAALTLSCGRPVEIVAVTARSKAKNRGVDLKRVRWVKDPITLARDPGIDVFVELMGGADDPAKRAVETALAAGKSVVTANKALLAKHGVALAKLAERHHVALNFEAAVAGGIPIVKTLREGLVGNKLARIYGILNGTCNYILTRMEQEGLSFADCLADAQRLGYAEADPTFDIEGHDTAQKLAILASLAFGTRVDPAAVYGQELTAQHELASDCTGIAHADAADWFKWYEQAAELGEPDAEVGYWHPALAQVSLVDLNEIGHRKDIAVVALQRARARGDWRALAAIGSLLKIGYFAEPDFFGAYAYFFAAAQAPTQAIDAVPWIDYGLGRVFAGPDTQTWLARELSDLGSRLDPAQRAQAEQLGVQLYEQCCAVAKR